MSSATATRKCSEMTLALPYGPLIPRNFMRLVFGCADADCSNYRLIGQISLRPTQYTIHTVLASYIPIYRTQISMFLFSQTIFARLYFFTIFHEIDNTNQIVSTCIDIETLMNFCRNTYFTKINFGNLNTIPNRSFNGLGG